MTYLGEALAIRLAFLEKPVVSNYEIFREIWNIYAEGKTKYLREAHPTKDIFLRTRGLLKDEGIIRQDHDYTRLWRVTEISDAPADEIVCLADPYCYISHLSAMQRYGLTDRRPEALLITTVSPQIAKESIRNQVRQDFGKFADTSGVYIEPLHHVRHPYQVRGRLVDAHISRKEGDWRALRGSFARIASIGQTFLDMVDEPKRCGGMLHILEVWAEHAYTFLDEIVDRVDKSTKAIHKVRAGYILSERLGIDDSRVMAWKKFAQRGGSQVLDPGRPYVDRYSEEWMISINVG